MTAKRSLEPARATLAELEHAVPFSRRHIGPAPADQTRMLATLGYASLAELAEAAVPPEIRMASDLDLPPAQTEIDVLAELRAIGQRNRVMKSMIGLGYYATHTPQVVLRKVLENPAWYTAYTPYQPEISQGRLEALLNFQTMVADLSGLPAANASLLDESTAAAEAMAICRRASAVADGSFVVDSDCLPQTIAVVQTRAEPLGLEVIVRDLDDGLPDGPIFGLLLQYPGASGALRDHEAVIGEAHERGALVAVASDPLAAVLCRPPGEIGADIVVGSSQRFGVPPAYGGPHAAFMCVRSGLERQLPGRLVGVSIDADGAPALRLALQTREQHIRREKATSNICTAQVLLAVMASMYAVYHGRDGLESIANRVHRFAAILAEGLRRGGLALRHDAFFDTIQVSVPHHADAVIAAARQAGVNLRRVDSNTVGIACDEVTERPEIEAVWAAFRVRADIDELDEEVVDAIPPALRRTSDFLTHPVFKEHRSETQMLRYLRRLSGRDVALDRSMIPLGSCTMKLNATTEMQAITWPEFASLHPFAPLDQADGYLSLIGDLERWLCAITGYDAVSLQPNSGAQGEYAGLLAIRGYHRSRGDCGARHLPDPRLRPRHERRERRDGGHARRRRRHGRAWQRRHGRPSCEACRARRARRSADDHLPLDARRVRDDDRRDLRARARRGRTGVRRRREHERPRRARAAWPLRRGCLAPEPAQDVLHPARRRRSGHRTGRRAGASPTAPSQPPPAGGRRPGRADPDPCPPRRGARRESSRSRGPTSG